MKNEWDSPNNGRQGCGSSSILKRRGKVMDSSKIIWHTEPQSCSAGAMKSPNLPLSLPLQNSSSGECGCGSENLKNINIKEIGKGSAPSVKERRFRRWTSLFQVVLVLVLLTMESVTVGGSEDWTLQCSSGCKCTWVSGKKTADCRGSHWTSIPSGLSPEVQVLEMGGGTIKMLPKDAFKSVGLVNLQKVFLQSCRIERIDRDAFRELTIMIELDLSGNLVSSLDMETFESNVRLRELKLSRNPLTKLTGVSFPALNYLKLLDLAECQLSSFPKKAFERLTVLETLSLSGNRFTYLSEELLRPLIKLKSLSLSGNPWKCDCRLKSLRDWVISKNLFQHHTKCVEPAHVANFPWDQLMSPDFACRPEIVSVQINGKPTDALLVHTDIGSDITLQCLVRGNPPPELKWVRDGQVLTNTSRSYGKAYYLHIGDEMWDFDDGVTGDYRGRWVNLTIQKTDPEDAGEYTCVGSNAGGVVEKNMTLNFQDVPSGAGVGHGLGGLGGGAYKDSGWIWILISVIAVLVFATTLVTLVCFCSRRRRVKTTRAQDLKGNGCEDQPQQRQLLLTPTSRSEGSEKLDDDGTTMLLMKEKYLVGPDARSQSADILNTYSEGGSPNRPQSAQPLTPRPPASSLITGPHSLHPSSEYPDLLDLPHARCQESPAPSTVSTLPDSTRMLITPQQLNPSLLVNPNRLGYQPYHQHPIYSTGRPGSPFGVAFSPAEPAMLPGGRPGYVTLPRRQRVPSWSPGPSIERDPTSPLCPSPTGSAATISFPFVKAVPKYDNLGPRTTADGSSRLSLNNIPDSAPNTPTSHSHPVLMTGTLGRHSVLRSTPTSMLGHPLTHFAPIQEVEPITSPSEAPEGIFEHGLPLAPSSIRNGQATKTDPSQDGTPTKSKKVPPKPPPKPVKKKVEEGVKEMPNSNGILPSDTDPKPVAKIPESGVTLGDDGTEV